MVTELKKCDTEMSRKAFARAPKGFRVSAKHVSR